MKRNTKWILTVWTIALISWMSMAGTVSAEKQDEKYVMDNWQVAWESAGGNWSVKDAMDTTVEWIAVDPEHSFPTLPDGGVDTAWVKLKLPVFNLDNPALHLPIVYAHSIDVYIDGRHLYTSSRHFTMDINELVVPLSYRDSGKWVYLKLHSIHSQMMIAQSIVLGDYQALQIQKNKTQLTDILLSGGFLLLAFIMLIGVIFLRKEQRGRWLALMLVIYACGWLLLANSPLMFEVYEEKGMFLTFLFDSSLQILFPALLYFFQKTIHYRYMWIIRRMLQIQLFYSAICLFFLVWNDLTSLGLFTFYEFLSVKVLSIFIISDLLLLLTISIINTIKGDRNALLFTIGFCLFALTTVTDMVLYIIYDEGYTVHIWKWGLVGFILSLVMILARRLSSDHHKLIRYSKELELFNNQIQRSEKMQIVSELAASVAHEVRNPLQVTRGFLQLLGEKTEGKNKMYLGLALEELDRAAHIITDFLTFAKPQFDQESILNLQAEMTHINGVLTALSNLQGGKINITIPGDLFIKGNSSKFKQAMINLVKNSVEALKGDGEIHITAKRKEEENEVLIHIRDTGEGMDAETLSKLGQPYFSTKTKGTGLGLMVTFRIVEVMQGSIAFSSERGVGTEVEIRLPSVEHSV